MTSTMKVAYISGPYRSETINGIYENIQNARKAALEYWQKGYAVICPHMNSALMDGACEDYVWLDGDLELLRRCDIIVMLKEWKCSAGAIAEFNEAGKHGLEIHYL